MNQSIVWRKIVNGFRDSCSTFDHVWMKRRRRFDTYNLTKAMLDLVSGSESSYLSVMDRLDDGNDSAPAASSFCKARSKIPSWVFSQINRELYENISELCEPMDWFGYTPLAMDGSTINIPTKMIGSAYQVVNGNTPTALLSSLVRLSDRLVFDLRLTPSYDEREQAHGFLEDLDSEHLIVYDRGYLSFGLLNDHVNRGVGGVFRVASGNMFRELEDFMAHKSNDQIVQIDPTDVTYRNAKKLALEGEIGPIEVRAIKYRIKRTTYLIISTITDKAIPAQAFVNLYKNRWKIEEFLKSFKMTIDAENFHSLSENRIEQEIACAGIVWNLSRGLDLASTSFKKSQPKLKNIALPMQLPPDHHLSC